MIKIDHLHFLIIDDLRVARESLRACVQGMGAKRIEEAVSYFDAINRVKRKAPDVVICDYNLSDSKDGQQLLEEIRVNGMLPPSHVFFMVTAEQAYQNVIAAVELKPDDYILKPFSPHRLKVRLEGAIERKIYLKPLFDALEGEDYTQALLFVDEKLKLRDRPEYLLDLLRHKGECLIALNRCDEAISLFDEIIITGDFPWAKVAKARALKTMNELDASSLLIDEVMASSQKYLDAIEVKASILEEQGDYSSAQALLQGLVKRNPRNNKRQSRLADVALKNGDVAVSNAAIHAIMKQIGFEGLNIDELFMFVRCKARQDNLSEEDRKQCSETLRGLKLLVTPESKNLYAAWHSLDALIHNNSSSQKRFISLRAIWLEYQYSPEVYYDLINAALFAKAPALAEEIVAKMIDSSLLKPVFPQINALFMAYNQKERLSKVQREKALALITHKN